jgi:hypothetical protein
VVVGARDVVMESSVLSPDSGTSTTIYASPTSATTQHSQFMLRDPSDRYATNARGYVDDDGSIPSPTYIKREFDGGRPGSEGDGKLSPSGSLGGSVRKKQKRNKPTLSCFECVERKTKVSAQPHAVNNRNMIRICHLLCGVSH